MPTAVTLFTAVTLLWAVVALGVEVVAAWGGGRREYSVRAGSPARGVLYAFTSAMTPRHKESIRLHPFAFGVGLLMHAGVLAALAGSFVLLAWPDAGASLLRGTRPLVLAALFASILLLARRMGSRALRHMSAPDDYVAALATCGLLALAGLAPGSPAMHTALLIYTGLLMIYIPLGKLRHVVFFFVARGDFGRRLGFRGVYPPGAAVEPGPNG